MKANFGQKHFDIFHEKISTALNIGSYLELISNFEAILGAF